VISAMPSFFSSREMVRLMPDGVRPIRSAAAVKDPVSFTATNAISASMSNIDDSGSKVYCSGAGFSSPLLASHWQAFIRIPEKNMPLALWALTLSAFAIGTTEFVIVGLIPTIAASLGVSVPSAGLLVSVYALGVAIGAPVLTALTGKVPRKQLLLGLMALF